VLVSQLRWPALRFPTRCEAGGGGVAVFSGDGLVVLEQQLQRIETLRSGAVMEWRKRRTGQGRGAADVDQLKALPLCASSFGQQALVSWKGDHGSPRAVFGSFGLAEFKLLKGRHAQGLLELRESADRNSKR